MNENIGDLVQRAKQKNQEAYEALYNQTKDSAYFVALSITHNEQDALDILQDSYIQAFSKLNTLQNNNSFGVWLNKIVANNSKNFIVKKKPVLFDDLTHMPSVSWEEEKNSDIIPHEAVDMKETARLVVEIIDGLKEDQRLCVLMYYYQDMKVSEIAKVLNISESNVKFKLYTARKAIKSAVMGLEKKGSRLYGVAIMPLLPLILSQAATTSSAPVFSTISAAVLQGTGSAAKATAGAVTGGLLSTIGGKVAITALAATLLVGGGMATKMIYDQNHLFVQYEVHDTYAMVVQCTGGGKCIEISAEYEGVPVTKIGRAAFKDCTTLTDIIIPDSVHTIDAEAFSGCSLLKAIEIPDSVMEIGSYAFSDCDSLKSIRFPKNLEVISNNVLSECDNLETVLMSDDVTNIEHAAFYNCISLENIILSENLSEITPRVFSNCKSLLNITLPDRITIIGVEAFSGCSGLKDITLSENLVSVHQSAFYGCTDLEELNIPKSVESIGANAFYGCTGLKELTVPENIISIGNLAFSGCTGLKSVNFEGLVKAIGYEAFSDCHSLTKVICYKDFVIENNIFMNCENLTDIYISEDNPYYTSEDGVIFNKEKTCLIAYPTGKVGSYIIPDGVTGIDSNAFRGAEGLTEIVIPASVSKIEQETFLNCINLKKVEIADGVKSIGDHAFYGCSSLESITIPNSVYNIGEGVFTYCEALKSVVLPEKLMNDQKNLFPYCTSLKDVTLTDQSADRTVYESNGFQYCLENNGSTVLKYIGNDTDVVVPASLGGKPVYRIEIYAFAHCNSVQSIVLPESVQSIGPAAFYTCTSLQSISMPSSIKTIGTSAFAEDKALKSISIPDGVKRIEEETFKDCTSLSNVSLPANLTYIGAYAFDSCKALKEIVFPDGLKILMEGAFCNCTHLKTVELPNSVMRVEQNTFLNCENLTEVILSENMDTISSCTFCYCTSLQKITLPKEIKIIDIQAFSTCLSLSEVTILNKNIDIDDSAFEDCEQVTIYAEKGSYAESYTTKRGMTFIATDEPSEPESSKLSTEK